MAKKSLNPKKKFTGKYASLNKPIVLPESNIPPITVLTTEKEKEQIEQKKWDSKCTIIALQEIFKKLELLYNYYGYSMKKNESGLFAMHLAFDYIPGFKFKYSKKSGAPKGWPPLKLVILNWKVNKILDEKRKANKPATIRSACNILKSEYGVEASTLQNRYSESKTVQ